MQDLIQALENAKKKLTKETWCKREYFLEKDGKLCMCAHGAVQSEVNPEVKKIISAADTAHGGSAHARAARPAGAARRATDARCAARASDASSAARAGVGAVGVWLRDNWNNRPPWTKDNYIYDNINYGNLDAHYLMGMVGLTIEFQDHPDTTFEMVQGKMDQAIQLAKDLNMVEGTKISKKFNPENITETDLFLRLETYVRVASAYPNKVVGIHAQKKIQKVLGQLNALRNSVFDTEAAAKEMAMELVED